MTGSLIFMSRVPATPIREHIRQVHIMGLYSGMEPRLLEALEYHLIEMAHACPKPVSPWYRPPTPPPALATMGEAFRRAAKNLEANLQTLRERREAREASPEYRERQSKAAFRAAIEDQRRIGLNRIRNHAYSVLTEMNDTHNRIMEGTS